MSDSTMDMTPPTGSRPRSTLAALGVLLLLTAGCARWEVIEQSRPSPLEDTLEVAIQWDFSGTELDDVERTGLGAKRAKRIERRRARRVEDIRSSYARTLGKTMKSRIRVVEADASEHGTVMLVKVDRIQEGMYVGPPATPDTHPVVSIPTEMDVRLQFSHGGEVTDEVAISCAVRATQSIPAPGPRLSICASRLGKITSKYLQARLRG